MNKNTRCVVKFGGSVIKEPSDLDLICKAVRTYPGNPVLVVSALYGVTENLSRIIDTRDFKKSSIDKLTGYLVNNHFEFVKNCFIDLRFKKEAEIQITRLITKLDEYLTGLRLIEDIPDFSDFYVRSFGERLSSKLVSVYLNSKGIKNIHTTPEEIGLFADRCSAYSSVDFKRSKQVRAILDYRHTFVIPGFYGKFNGTRVSLFGKGGSDYTAAAIANLIDAEYCDLWKDVDGFMTTDPKLEEKAQRISELTYDEAAELSYFGARIIHPETFAPLKSQKIPLRIFNINNFLNSSATPIPSTMVSEKITGTTNTIKSITYSDDYSILRVRGSGVGIHPGIISGISDRLNRIGINIRSIITTQTSINFLLDSNDILQAYGAVVETDLPGVEKIETEEDISLIAAVGSGIREKYGIASKILSALSGLRINIRLITAGASDEAIYFTLKREECIKAVKTLHRQFFKKRRKK